MLASPGDAHALAAVLRARTRAGELESWKLELAAYCLGPAALLLTRATVLATGTSWLAGLDEFGQRVAVRAALSGVRWWRVQHACSAADPECSRPGCARMKALEDAVQAWLDRPEAATLDNVMLDGALSSRVYEAVQQLSFPEHSECVAAADAVLAWGVKMDGLPAWVDQLFRPGISSQRYPDHYMVELAERVARDLAAWALT